MKQKRLSDQAARDKISGQPCAVCCLKIVDCAHIKSRGSGGGDFEWNMIPLCRIHHTQQHKVGWKMFAALHPSVLQVLTDKGWSFTPFGKIVRQI